MFPKSQPWVSFLLGAINNGRCKTWDMVHGVDTCGQIPLSRVDFQAENKVPGLEYHSHHPGVSRAALKSLNVQHENYTFIDVGCGKGRMLLLASEFPFRRIIGLEFAPPLAMIAKRNVQTYRWNAQRCRKIEVLTGDATEYELPPEPAVLYFYNPFPSVVMGRVFQNIESSMERTPRDLVVVFTGPFPARDRAFGVRPQYQRLLRERYFDIYRRRLP